MKVFWHIKGRPGQGGLIVCATMEKRSDKTDRSRSDSRSQVPHSHLRQPDGDPNVSGKFESPNEPLAANAAAPGKLLSKHLLIGAVINASWRNALDIQVAWHVLDRFVLKYGNSRVSFSYLEKATGASRSRISRSLRRLEENGVISVISRGEGTRPTEYLPNFAIVASVRSLDTTSVRSLDTASNSSVRSLDTQSLLPRPVYKRVDGKEGSPATAAASATAAGAPTPTPTPAARVPENKFDELWDWCWRQRDYAAAKAEYARINPDLALHGKIVAGLLRWRATYDRENWQPEYKKHLHVWLRQERWREDGPTRYVDRKAVSSARKAAAAAPKRKDDKTKAQKADSNAPRGRKVATSKPTVTVLDRPGIKAASIAAQILRILRAEGGIETSEKKLAANCDASRSTTRKALQDLAACGKIVLEVKKRSTVIRLSGVDIAATLKLATVDGQPANYEAGDRIKALALEKAARKAAKLNGTINS